MDQNQEGTGLRFYSFGIVVKDNTEGGDLIQVSPTEELPQLLGKLSDIKMDYNVQGKDHRGVDSNANVQGVAYVVAQWTPWDNGNRNTAPNVSEGETVILLKYGNADEIYWIDFMREPRLRRLEDVVYAYSNLVEKNKQAYDGDSSYYVRVSTRDQLIHLHTSKNRDEPVGFDVTINTAKGNLRIEDTNENFLDWDAPNHALKIKMNESIDFEAKRISINGHEYVRTKAPEITETGDNITNNAAVSLVDKSGGTLISEAATTNTVKGGVPVIITPGFAAG